MNITEALELSGGIDSYERQEAYWLLAHILNKSVLDLKLNATQVLTDEQITQYTSSLVRLKNNEPLAYIIGSQPFWTLDLDVTPDTLVPRPDTEILIETVLDLNLSENASILDLGTGTGAIALALASEKPNWNVLATDIYIPTLAVAKQNAKKHNLQHVNFMCSVWYDNLTVQKFDLIVSNPPYIDEKDCHLSDLKTEPYRALVSPKHGLADLEKIISGGALWLKNDAWLVVEHGHDQKNAVQQIFKQAGFSHVRTVQDYGKNDRVTLGQWLKNSN